MTFDDIWNAAELGAIVAVSDGTPRPPDKATQRLRAWRSHNMSGPLVEKIDGAPRKLRVEAVNEPGLRVLYDIEDGPNHSFELVI